MSVFVVYGPVNGEPYKYMQRTVLDEARVPDRIEGGSICLFVSVEVGFHSAW